MNCLMSLTSLGMMGDVEFGEFGLSIEKIRRAAEFSQGLPQSLSQKCELELSTGLSLLILPRFVDGSLAETTGPGGTGQG